MDAKCLEQSSSHQPRHRNTEKNTFLRSFGSFYGNREGELRSFGEELKLYHCLFQMHSGMSGGTVHGSFPDAGVSSEKTEQWLLIGDTLLHVVFSIVVIITGGPFVGVLWKMDVTSILRRHHDWLMHLVAVLKLSPEAKN